MTTFRTVDAAEACVFKQGRALLHLPGPRQQLVEAPDLFLWPGVWGFDHVRVMSGDGAILDGCGGDGGSHRLFVAGLVVNPVLLRRGATAGIVPQAPGRFRIALEEPAEAVSGTVFLGTGAPIENYYHGLLDTLPRLRTIVAVASRLAPDEPLRVAVEHPYPPFMSELLTLAGIPPTAVVPYGRGRPRVFERLIAVTAFCQYGFIHPTALTLLPPPPPPPPLSRPPRRLLVSRSDASGRRLLNEEAVLDALAPLGVERVVPSRLSLGAQRALFAEADLVIGPHGAGLANMVWTPPGCALLELRPPVDALWQYERLCRALGRRHGGLVVGPERCTAPADTNGDFSAEPRQVATGARLLLGPNPGSNPGSNRGSSGGLP